MYILNQNSVNIFNFHEQNHQGNDTQKYANQVQWLYALLEILIDHVGERVSSVLGCDGVYDIEGTE